MKSLSLGALIGLFGSSMAVCAPLNINFSNIYVVNKTQKAITVSPQQYEKSGFDDAGKYTKSVHGFVIKPGKRVKVASLDRDQSSYPDNDKRKYVDKHAKVSFSINDSIFFWFTSAWNMVQKVKPYESDKSLLRSVDLLPLSSTLTVNNRSLPCSIEGASVRSYYVFPKLYHDVEIVLK